MKKDTPLALMAAEALRQGFRINIVANENLCAEKGVGTLFVHSDDFKKIKRYMELYYIKEGIAKLTNNEQERKDNSLEKV